jgi:FG-GAP repeat protein
MFAATRSRSGGLAFLVVLLCVCAAAPARAAVPGGYAVDRVDGPGNVVLSGARLGETVVNAGDVTGDGKEDILVGAPSATISSGITGRVFLFSGGEMIWQAAPPALQPGNVAGSDPTRFGAAMARLGDIGSCVSSGSSCTVGARDGKPEFLVSAPGTDTGGPEGQDEGVVYVLDGASGQFLKEVRLAATDRPALDSGGFGKALAALAGAPPCRGSGGVQQCGPQSAASLGDASGDGTPDFAVGAPDYTELGGGETVNCTAEISCPGLGRVYVVHGELITGSAQTPLQLSVDVGNTSFIQFPGTGDAGQPPRFGSALTPVGDVGGCAGEPGGGPTCIGVAEALNSQPDGAPDLLATAPGADTGAASEAGAAFIVDARGNAAMVKAESPGPQSSGAFGSFRASFAAPGDLNLDGVADALVGAPGEGTAGGAFMLNGNVASADRVLRTLSDPAPVAGGSFGASLAALGDITGDGAGEVAVGAADGSRSGSVHIFSACAREVLGSVGDPDAQEQAAFGAAIVPVGDRNGDGMLDLAVGAPGFDGAAGQNQGRAYLLTSDGSVAAVPAACGGSGTGGGGGDDGGGEEALPPEEGKVVVTRILRRLVLKANHRRVRKEGRFRLHGRLTASSLRRVCQRGQKIALQRRRTSGSKGARRFQTFDVAVTRATGAFSTRAIAERTYVYRARVSQTSRCMGAVSRTAKVSVLRSRSAG